MALAKSIDPAVVLVHGAWHTPNHYRDLLDRLRTAFGKVACPQLPSSTETMPFPENASLPGDTAVIRRAIQDFADEGHPIILLMHSYGGLVGTNACKGLLWAQRAELGKTGGVVYIIFFAAFLQPAGSAALDPFGGQMPPWSYEDEKTGAMYIPDLRAGFYNHVSDDAEAELYISTLRQCPARVLKDVQDFDPFGYVGKGLEATYVVVGRDRDLKVEIQEGMAGLLGDERVIRRLDEAGHCAQVGFAGDIVGFVREGWERSKLRLEREGKVF